MKHYQPLKIQEIKKKLKTYRAKVFNTNLELIQLSKTYLRRDKQDTISHLRDIDQL
jgi:hypothetical protein